MQSTITAKYLYTPLEKIEAPLIFVSDGTITGISRRSECELPSGTRIVDLGEAILAPGFFDMHIHGGAGHDVMEGDEGALPAVERFLAQHGVTSYLPTTVTAPLDRTLAALERLADAVERSGQPAPDRSGPRARAIGIHLEGPFLSHLRRGVHPPEDLLPPTLKIFEKFWEASRGHIKVITIAPELEGAREVIAEATRRGVCVSMGHSDATSSTAQAAVAAGVRHATHTFNAMRPLDHRDPGILGEVLTDQRLTAEIIADGVHVDPLVVRLFLHAKGQDTAVLVTDATAATGMPNGRYRLGSLEVDVKDGKCTANGKLAGSVLTMDKAVRNIMKFANWDLQSSLRLASLNPARAVGLAKTTGQLVPGAVADIVALSPAGDVLQTIVRGEVA
jgi:N-acetylglucosamine-6-phosphate deacetylase